MQFRERRKVIQLIRTVYDPAIKRGRAELVGKLDKADPVLTESLRAVCTADEVAEIEQFLRERSATLSREATREAADSLARHMRLAETYFRLHPEGASGAAAAEILTAWDDLKKALHKAGFRKHADTRGKARGNGAMKDGRA